MIPTCRHYAECQLLTVSSLRWLTKIRSGRLEKFWKFCLTGIVGISVFISCFLRILLYACMDPSTTKPQLYNMALKSGDQATFICMREVQRRRAAEQRARFLKQRISQCQRNLEEAKLKVETLKDARLLLLNGGNIFLYLMWWMLMNACLFG